MNYSFALQSGKSAVFRAQRKTLVPQDHSEGMERILNETLLISNLYIQIYFNPRTEHNPKCDTQYLIAIPLIILSQFSTN